MRTINLTGRRFGRLVVQGRAPTEPGCDLRWECICDCGGTKTTVRGSLRAGHTRSCGCLQVEAGKKTKTHGHGRNPLYNGKMSPTYRSWASMKDRCRRKNGPDFHNYGGRGITVCDRWRGSFENFLADMGERPSQAHTLDRKEVNGNYEPSNCRWATYQQQNRNRRTNRLLEIDGETITITEASERFNIDRGTLSQRLGRGWDLQRALTDRERLI